MQTKYRAWDKVNKKMNYDGDVGTYESLYIEINGDLIKYEYDQAYDGDDFEIDQFTGKTDTQGKKEFEGDIRKCAHTGTIFVIVWHEFGWHYRFVKNRRYEGESWKEYVYLPLRCRDTIYLGNIHETPELVPNIEKAVKE